MTLAPIQLFPFVPAMPEVPRLSQRLMGQKFPGRIIRDAAIETEMSPIAVLLSEEGMDFERSIVRSSSEQMHFDLTFTRKDTEQLTASGYLNRSSRTLDLKLDYSFQSEDRTQQPPAVRSFQVQIRLSVSEVRSKVFAPFVKKEDILSMVRQFLTNLHSLTNTGRFSPTGSVLSADDLLELAHVDHGRQARNLENLIDLVVLLARLKELLEGDRPDVVLQADRNESKGPAVSLEHQRFQSLEISIREIPDNVDPDSDTNAESNAVSAEELPTDPVPQSEEISPTPAALL